jgi:hypothetical protein
VISTSQSIGNDLSQVHKKQNLGVGNRTKFIRKLPFIGITMNLNLEQSYLGSDCATDPSKSSQLSIYLGCSA